MSLIRKTVGSLRSHGVRSDTPEGRPRELAREITPGKPERTARMPYNQFEVGDLTPPSCAGRPDVRTVHRKGKTSSIFCPVRGQPARKHLDRDRAPAARPDSRGQRPDKPDLRPLAPLPREHPQGD